MVHIFMGKGRFFQCFSETFQNKLIESKKTWCQTSWKSFGNNHDATAYVFKKDKTDFLGLHFHGHLPLGEIFSPLVSQKLN